MPLHDEEWEEASQVAVADVPDLPPPLPEPPPEPRPAPPPEPPPAEPEPEPIAEFDPRSRDDFQGLLYIGALTTEFDWLGHTFTLRTMTVDEILEVGLIAKDYVGSMGEVKAYQAAVVAGCVIKLDGKPMPIPLTDDPSDSGLRNRFRVVKKWFPPALDAVYEEYLMLEARVGKVIEAMGKVSG